MRIYGAIDSVHSSPALPATPFVTSIPAPDSLGTEFCFSLSSGARMEWGPGHVWNTLPPSYNPVLGKTLNVDIESWSLVATDSN